jgi:hypothetical protein
VARLTVKFGVGFEMINALVTSDRAISRMVGKQECDLEMPQHAIYQSGQVELRLPDRRIASRSEAQHRKLQISHLKRKASQLGFQIIQASAA